jgi:molybdopterin synthase sulfur carrier subunit
MSNNVTVVIPTPFREYTDGESEVTVEATTVNEAISDLAEKYPGIEDDLLTDDGDLENFVNVYRNDEDIRQDDSLETTLEAGDELSIIPAIAGGQDWYP